MSELPAYVDCEVSERDGVFYLTSQYWTFILEGYEAAHAMRDVVRNSYELGRMDGKAAQ